MRSILAKAEHHVQQIQSVAKLEIKVASGLRKLVHWMFDLTKNIVMLSALKAFARTYHIHYIAVIATLLQISLTISLGSYIDPIYGYLKRIGFTTKREAFLIFIVVITIALVNMAVNVTTFSIVEALSRAQTK